jgi:hypothetical protein
MSCANTDCLLFAQCQSSNCIIDDEYDDHYKDKDDELNDGYD